MLILEKAPEAEEGGNTSVCGGEAYSHQNIQSAIQYLTAMNGLFPLDKDLVEVWANKMADNGNWMTNVLECKTTTWRPWEEFPELPGVKDSGCLDRRCQTRQWLGPQPLGSLQSRRRQEENRGLV